MQVTEKEIENAVDLVECLVMDNETTFKDIDQLEGKVEGLKEYVESLIEQVTILTRKVEQLENRLE
jgi:polyhydroxyalkanoate synthesis regulator phasin